MMLEAVMLMVSVVLFNHMELRDAVESVTRYKFKVLSCAKCGTFWSVLIYLLLTLRRPVESVTAAFILSYAAIWFELLLGYLGMLYENSYDKIQTPTSDTDEGSAESEVSEM